MRNIMAKSKVIVIYVIMNKHESILEFGVKNYVVSHFRTSNYNLTCSICPSFYKGLTGCPFQ